MKENPIPSDGWSVVTRNSGITQHHHLRAAFEASGMFSNRGLCCMSLPKLSTWQLFLGQALLPSSPTPTFSHCSPRTGEDSLELRCGAAGCTRVSAEVSRAGHIVVHCPALSPPMSLLQELYGCIKIGARKRPYRATADKLKMSSRSTCHIWNLLLATFPRGSSFLFHHSFYSSVSQGPTCICSFTSNVL